jgi:hypothetical protein
MRRANMIESKLLRDENDAIYGVVLAGDYTAEQENGIIPLQWRLGIEATGPFETNKTPAPVADRIHAGGFVASRFKNHRIVRDNGQFLTTSDKVAEFPSLLLSRRYEECVVTGAFDDQHFAIGLYGDQAAEIANNLQEGFEQGDIAVWLGGTPNPYSRGGLAIARASQVPTDWRQRYDELVRERAEVARLATETGIIERIHAAAGSRHEGHLGYFALTAVRPMKDSLTSYPVMFLQNPRDQKWNASGYYTVEELDLWIEGKGPVVENSRGAKARWVGVPIA